VSVKASLREFSKRKSLQHSWDIFRMHGFAFSAHNVPRCRAMLLNSH